VQREDKTLADIYRDKAKENERLGGGDKKSGLENSPTPINTRVEVAKIARVSLCKSLPQNRGKNS